MLDPQRIPLNAERVGFLQRTGQEVDWAAYKQAMQTEYNNQNSAIEVRREREAKKNELHIMGGEGAGFESNSLLLTTERQQRQINGYPLRHFSAESPAIVLPKKYGGFPMYNRNQLEYPELVSVFTEPMSAPLQQNTELLSRAGQVQLSNDSANPYEPESFVNPLTRDMDSIQQNENVFRQRKHLRTMSSKSIRQKQFHVQSGIYINKNGLPVTGASDEVMSDMAQNQMFGIGMAGYSARQQSQLRHEPQVDAANSLVTNNNAAGLSSMLMSPNQASAAGQDIVSSVTGRSTSFMDVESPISYGSMGSLSSGPPPLTSASSRSSSGMSAFRSLVNTPLSERGRGNFTDIYSSPESRFDSSPFNVSLSPVAVSTPQIRSNILLSEAPPSSGRGMSQQAQGLRFYGGDGRPSLMSPETFQAAVASGKKQARAMVGESKELISPMKTRSRKVVGINYA
jgi:hypothetical protein